MYEYCDKHLSEIFLCIKVINDFENLLTAVSNFEN